MSRSVADYDITRLSAAARETLQQLAIPLSEGAKQDELAERLGITKREISTRMNELRRELDDQAQGATVRPMTQAEYEALRDSIAEHGQLVPAIVDERGHLIDGHNRARACEELGIQLWTVPASTSTTEQHALELAINFVRRQLAAGDRRRAIAAELRRDATRSDRSIASLIGVSPTTVGAVRDELQADGQLSNLDSRRGADGRTRRVPAPPPASTEPEPGTRLDYIIEELHSLAALTDREHAHARADTLLLEALRHLGGERVADAWEHSGPRYYGRGGNA